MKTKTNILITLITIMGVILPHTAGANSMIVSTVKNPDLYNNNLSWFRYYQYPGKTIKDSLVLRNIGTEEETVKLYATDANVNQAGSFSPKMEDEEQQGIGKWLILSEKEVTLAPSESREISFEIHLPQSIAPGQYFGSIINEQLTENLCDNSVTANDLPVNCPGDIQVKTRTGNRIYLTIPGEIKHDITLRKLVWKLSSQNKTLFTFNITNNGNVAFQPEAILHIYNTWGQEVEMVQSRLGKSLPGSSTSPMIEWDSRNHYGQFTVKAEIYYREDDQGRFDSLRGTILTENVELGVFLFPWTGAIIGGGILLILLAIYFGRKKYYQRLQSHSFEYTVQEGDTIISIADSHRKNWKTIARINNLRPPFVLGNGQKIKIPTSHNQNNEK